MASQRRTIARGIYEDRYGFEVQWRDRGLSRSKRFPRDTTLDHLKAWRRTKVLQATDKREPLGSFVRDAVRFLARRRRLVSFKSDRAHLRPWIHRFRTLSRFAVTREHIQAAIEEWAAAGYSPRTLRHRRRILGQLLTALDPDRANPCAHVKLPKIVKRKPRPVEASLIRDVALNLRKQELVGRLWSAKTRARFLVLALTGVRPAQLMRAQPGDLDWSRGLWYVDPAKGDEGTIVAFNEQTRAAWTVFVQAQAWGPYDTRSFAKTLRRNGWPKGVRPYQLRHTVGQTLKELGADLGSIQDHLGHSSPVTTRQFYVGPSLTQLRQTSAQLDGRLEPFALDLPDAPPRMSKKQKAKDRQNRPRIASAADRRKAGAARPPTTKPA
jgi:integrase